MFSPYRLLQAVLPTHMPNEIHDGTASSFLDALVHSGDNPPMDTINAILSSFSHLNHTEQDKVIESPKVNSKHYIPLNKVKFPDAET